MCLIVAPIYNLPNGHLGILGRERISVRPVGMNGIVPHRENIMPQDPPNPVRPKPQFSVTWLTKGIPAYANRYSPQPKT